MRTARTMGGVMFLGLAGLFAVQHVFGAAAANSLCGALLCFATLGLLPDRK